MSDWYDSAKRAANKLTGKSHSSFARAFAEYWDQSAAGIISAGVKPVTAQANLSAAPTQTDFNTLLANLKSAGVLK